MWTACIFPFLSHVFFLLLPWLNPLLSSSKASFEYPVTLLLGYGSKKNQRDRKEGKKDIHCRESYLGTSAVEEDEPSERERNRNSKKEDQEDDDDEEQQKLIITLQSSSSKPKQNPKLAPPFYTLLPITYPIP
ncbi:hypothetical protein K1719_029972 [Acacia pycnantha]|nr:hypothetical protein K1719_029972 [Acacia pycnantha]